MMYVDGFSNESTTTTKTSFPHLERNPGQVLGLPRLRGGEHHRLPFLGQKTDDLLHFLLEADVEDPISLVDDQALHVLEQKVGTVLHVVQETSGGRDEDVHA